MPISGMQGAMIGGAASLGAFGLLIAAGAVKDPDGSRDPSLRNVAQVPLVLGSIGLGVAAVAGAAFVNSHARGPYVVGALAGAALGTALLAMATGNDLGAIVS